MIEDSIRRLIEDLHKHGLIADEDLPHMMRPLGSPWPPEERRRASNVLPFRPRPSVGLPFRPRSEVMPVTKSEGPRGGGGSNVLPFRPRVN